MRLKLILPDIEEPTELTWKFSKPAYLLLSIYNTIRGQKYIKSVPKRFEIPPLGLLTVASLTPAGVDISIIDERIKRVVYDEPVDLVGISVTTQVSARAYTIAEAFRKRGITVVLGGVHPTLLPEEAAMHADAVVVGEAEIVWPQLVEDFQEGRLKKFYYGGHNFDLSYVPNLRRELIDNNQYITPNVVQVGRGCPHNCSFCSVTRVYGGKYRHRPVSEVVREIQSLSGKFILFLDDNLLLIFRYPESRVSAGGQESCKMFQICCWTGRNFG